MQKEIQLAKSELKVSVKNGGTGVGLFAGAVFFAVMGLVMFSIGLAYLFHWNGDGLDLQWAFLMVFAIYLLVAALLGYLGYRKVQKVRGPEKAIAEAQKTPRALKGQSGPRPGALTPARRARRPRSRRRCRWRPGRCWPARSPRCGRLRGREGVAGLGVGHRRGEHHARPPRRPRTRSARPSCRAGPGRAARTPRG